MHQRRHAFEQFIDAVVWRLVLTRAAEGAGLVSAFFCGFYSVYQCFGIVTPPLIEVVVIAALLCVLSAALLRALIKWALRCDAASRADGQFGLADLLSTALSLKRRGNSDCFADAVLAQADGAVSRLKASQVPVAKFSRRVWAAVALAIIGSSVVNILAATSRDVSSGANASFGITAIPVAQADGANVPRNRDPARAFGVDHPTGTDENDRNRVESDPSQGSRHVPGGNPGSTDNTGNGGGAGLAQGNFANQPRGLNNASAGGTGNTGNTGQSALGSGGTGTNGNGSSERAGFGTGVSASLRPAPAWDSQAWPGGRDAAHRALREGRIAGDYAPLIRAYFDR